MKEPYSIEYTDLKFLNFRTIDNRWSSVHEQISIVFGKQFGHSNVKLYNFYLIKITTDCAIFLLENITIRVSA